MSDLRLVTQADAASDLDWSRAEERSLGETTGLDPDSQTFWIRLSDLDFVGLSGLVTKSLEAHGWEANLENILLAMDSLRIGRRVRLRPVTSGQKQRAMAFERVVSLSLPNKGQSSPLLSMLYALVSGSEAPARQLASRDINDHPAVKALQARLAALEEENASLRRRSRQRLNEAQETASVVQQARSDISGLSAELGVVSLQVRSVDIERAVVTFRGDGRAFELGIEQLTHLPDPGAMGIGLREGGALVGVLPMGTGWRLLDYVQATVLATLPNRLKLRLPGRTEVVVPFMRRDGSSQAQPRRHDKVVAVMAGQQGLALWTGSPVALAAVLRERQLRLAMLEHEHRLLAILDSEAGDGRFDDKSPLPPGSAQDLGKKMPQQQQRQPKGKVG
jgi:hypothetical protein